MENKNKSDYYNGDECIEAMEKTQGAEYTQGFCICNAFKYLWRWRGKNGVEDIRKAKWYIDKFLELEEKPKQPQEPKEPSFGYIKKDENQPWKPKPYQRFWSIDSNGKANMRHYLEGYSEDEELINLGNCFETKGEAKKHVDEMLEKCYGITREKED